MRNKANLTNIVIDANYPYGRIKDNTGAGDGTPVNEFVYGDIHQFFAKLITLAGIVPNDLPDNEINNYQTIQALKEFASKNNYIQNLSSVSGVLNVSAKLGLMQTDEFLVCKSSVDLGLETQIKGTDGTTFTIATIGTFKTNEYVRLIKTASSIVLVRISDSASLDLMVSELLYLKKASQAEENAGAIDTKATTPLVNKVAFTRRVIGADSGSYLAKPTGDPDARNGLLSAADKLIIDNFTNTIINKGFVSGIEVGVSVGSMAVGGNITSAVASTLGSDGTKILVTVANAMANTNYLVKIYVQGQSASLISDNNVCVPVFKPLSTTQFEIGLAETVPEGQNLKLHLEVQQL